MTPDNSATHAFDVGAITIWIAAFAQVLPSIAAALSIIWFALRILETQTVQKMLGRYGWIKENKHGSED